MPFAAEFADLFADNEIGSGWTTYSSPPLTTVGEVNSTAVISLNATTTQPGGFSTAGTYTLNGSHALLRVLETPSSGTNHVSYFYQKLDNNNYYFMQVEAADLRCGKVVAGVITFVVTTPYSPITHAAWRIRESNGSVRFDTWDGATWTNRGVTSVDFLISAVRGEFGCHPRSAIAQSGRMVVGGYNALFDPPKLGVYKASEEEVRAQQEEPYPAVYNVYLRDGSLRRVGQFQKFRMTAIMRHNLVGKWELTAESDNYLADKVDESSGIIIERNGKVIFSGPVRMISESRSRGHVGVLTIGGPDDSAVFSERWAAPVPLGPPYTTAAHDVFTGIGEDAMRHYIQVNAGGSARLERRRTGIALAPTRALGSVQTERARFQMLQETMERISLGSGGLGFRVLQSGQALHFEAYMPRDRTKEAVFSFGRGNLADYSYQVEAPKANYIVVAGGGEMQNRIFIEGGDQESIAKWGRIEFFVDARDTVDLNELQKRISAALIENGERVSLRVTPIDTKGMRFGQQYDLGDTVTIEAGRGVIQETLTEVKLELGPGLPSVTPVIGDPAAQDILSALEQEREAVDRRVSNLERQY